MGKREASAEREQRCSLPPSPGPQQQKSIVSMESIMDSLCKSGGLFEVTVPDYKQLKACHKEVRLLKELWDMIVMVRGVAGTRCGQGRPALRGPGEGLGGGVGGGPCTCCRPAPR